MSIAVGDTEKRPKTDIRGQASLGIKTDPCVDFPAGEQTERVRGETNFRIKTTWVYVFSVTDRISLRR